MTISKAALRKRVSRIEKQLAQGKPVTKAMLDLVREYRKSHRRYTKTETAIAQAERETRDLDATDEELIREQHEIAALEGEDPSNAQTDAHTEANGHVTVDEVESDLSQHVTETMDVPASQAGLCPVGTCRAPIVDGQLRCGKCGANVRPDLCPKCKDPFAENEQFCRRDGTPRPTAKAATIEVRDGKVVAVEHPVIKMWTKKNTKWVCDGVDLILDKSKMDKLDEEEKETLIEALVPVLNKRLPASGAWAEEIRLGVIFAGMMLPRLYVRLIILPEREAKQRRLDEESKARIEVMRQTARREPTQTEVDLKVDLPKSGGV